MSSTSPSLPIPSVPATLSLDMRIGVSNECKCCATSSGDAIVIYSGGASFHVRPEANCSCCLPWFCRHPAAERQETARTWDAFERALKARYGDAALAAFDPDISPVDKTAPLRTRQYHTMVRVAAITQDRLPIATDALQTIRERRSAAPPVPSPSSSPVALAAAVETKDPALQPIFDLLSAQTEEGEVSRTRHSETTRRIVEQLRLAGYHVKDEFQRKIVQEIMKALRAPKETALTGSQAAIFGAIAQMVQPTTPPAPPIVVASPYPSDPQGPEDL